MDEVKASNLRGRGGAGFPTGQKWSFVPWARMRPRPKYVISNSDEMEPGAFKDRVLMEGNPHQLVEGLILAAYAVKAQTAYIFLRWEYGRSAARLERPSREAYEREYLGKNILGSGSISTCASTPAPAGTSAARKRPFSTRSRGNGPSRGTSRPFPRRAGSGESRRSSTTPKPSPTFPTSS